MCGRLDTGLVLVVFMTLSMVLTVVCLLSLVQYQHCPVLFPNNTVSGVLSKIYFNISLYHGNHG